MNDTGGREEGGHVAEPDAPSNRPAVAEPQAALLHRQGAESQWNEL